MRTRRLTTLTIGAAIAALIATGCEWHFETLDGPGGPNGNINADVGFYDAAILDDGRLRVFHQDETNDTLRHAYYTGSAWGYETLDGNGGPNGRTTNDVGRANAAVLYKGNPHVFNRDNTFGDVRHAYWNGQFWAFETLDGNGGPHGRINADVGWSNATVLYDGRPHVFYRDEDGGDLRHAYYTGSAWGFETLDGNGGADGRINANVGMDNAAILYNGRPHVFYYDSSGRTLRHAYWNGSFWAFETLDGNGGPNGRISNFVGDHNAVVLLDGHPHVFYRGPNTLRHAYYTGSAWGFETLDGNGGPYGRINANVGAFNAAVLYGGRPHVFYQDATNRHLRHAYYTGTAWGFETLDGAGGPNGRIVADTGLTNTAVPYKGRPDVFYYDRTGGNLRHAYFG